VRALTQGIRTSLAVLLAALLAAGAAAGEPLRVGGRGVELACEQGSAAVLACRYRLLPPGEAIGAEASLAGTPLPAPELLGPPAERGPGAVLLLVDTSDPRRQAAVHRAVEHLRLILERGRGRYAFGLASFDSTIRLLAPLGTPVEEIERASAGIEAVGKTTELYRSAIEAIRVLAAYPAEPRALFLFSDGLAEDRAYFHDDVIAAARAAGVVIYGIGYPRSTALSVALQSLRRLAEETGGRFVAADQRGFELPAEFLAEPFAGLDRIGRLRIDLRPALAAGLGGAQTVRLALLRQGGRASVEIPVTLPPPPPPEPVVKVVEVPKVIEVPKVVEVPAQAAPAPAPPAAAKPPLLRPSARWLSWLAGAVGVALIVALLALERRRRRRREEGAGAEPPAALRTFAYLELQDGSGIRHPVTSVAFRIGRHGDNDLVLKDPSISRHHAEIHRRRDGTFTITDLESLNGVFVNGRKLKTSPLKEGDLLEIGDITLRFGVRSDPDLPGEETVILHTVTPREPPLTDTLGDSGSERSSASQ